MAHTEVAIYVIDDDQAICRLVVAALGKLQWPIQCHGSAADFLSSCNPQCRGCVILDIQLPDMSGVQVQEILRERGIQMPVLILSGTADVSTATAVMKRGAIDLIQKPFDPELLAEAVQNAIDLDAQTYSQRQERLAAEEVLARLTPRESQVLRHLVAGLANKQIAIALGVSERTVEVHRGRVMGKTGAGSVAELVRLWSLVRSIPPATKE